MAVYNVNQNNQFYVVKSITTETPAAEGEVQIVEIPKDGQITFKHMGKGGLTRTDLIDLDKICYKTLTEASEMYRYPKKAVVKLSEDVNEGKPIIGEDYVLRIQINNALSPGDASVYIKSSAVHATKAMNEDKTLFYKKMVESLERNFSREPGKLLTFEATADGIVIREAADQPWRLGVLSQDPVNFEVIATTVRFNGEDEVWAELNEKGVIEVVKDPDAEPIKNGRQIADLEYFCMAERGDMFRNMGYPLNIDVKMSVNPDEDYHMLVIHYYFSGSGVQVHKSEKDLTFVSTDKGILDSIYVAINNAAQEESPM